MSVVKIEKHYCDVCKNEMPPRDYTRECKIDIKVTFGNENGYSQDSIYNNFEVCDKCMEEMGFNPTPVFYKERCKLENTLKDNIKNIIKKIIPGIKK